jgi:hypothetical protein
MTEIDQTINRNSKSTNCSQMRHFMKNLQNTDIITNFLNEIYILETKNNWTTKERDLLDSIDSQFTNALIQSEKACKINYEIPWSPELHKAYLITKYWKIKIGGKGTNKNTNTQINNIKKTIGDPR